MKIWRARSPFQTAAFQPSDTRRPTSSLASSELTPPGVSTPSVPPSFWREPKVQIPPPERRPRARLRRSRWRGCEGRLSTGSRESFRVRWGERRAGAKFFPFRRARPKFFGGFEKNVFCGSALFAHLRSGGVFLPSGISVSLRDRPAYRSSFPCSGRTSGSSMLETEFDEPTIGRETRGVVHRTRVAKPPPRGSETDKYETRKVYLGSKTAFRPPTTRRQKEHVAS